MPPKKEEGPHKTVVNAARTSIAGINNAIFTRSIQGLKKTATKNTIIKAYKNTLKRNANEKEAAEAAELERTGGIDLEEEIDKYKNEWKGYEPHCKKHFSGKGYVLTPEMNKMLAELNKHLRGVQQFNPQCTSSGMIETNGASYYADHAIARDIMRGDYDTKLEQLKYVVKRDGQKVIAGDNGRNLLFAISKRKENLVASPPGGGAGFNVSEGGARRRRRTHKRKATRRRKTHRKH